MIKTGLLTLMIAMLVSIAYFSSTVLAQTDTTAPSPTETMTPTAAPSRTPSGAPNTGLGGMSR